MGDKILVTGATGKVGSEILKQLIAKGADVRAGFHHPEKANVTGAEVVAFDYSNPATVEAALVGVNKLFLMSPGNNAEQENRVTDLAKKAGVKHIVKLSAAGVEANDNSPLRIAEKHIEASGVAYTFLRPSWFSQNFSTGQLENIRAGEIRIPAGEGKTGFVDTRDIAAVAVAAFTEEGHANKAYIITGEKALDHFEVAAILSEAIGKEVRYEPITDEEFRAITTAQHWPQEIAETMSMLYGLVRNGWTSIVTNTVTEVLGRQPISFEQYAADHAEIWK